MELQDLPLAPNLAALELKDRGYTVKEIRYLSTVWKVWMVSRDKKIKALITHTPSTHHTRTTLTRNV